jgi:hypothetical protein
MCHNSLLLCVLFLLFIKKNKCNIETPSKPGIYIPLNQKDIDRLITKEAKKIKYIFEKAKLEKQKLECEMKNKHNVGSNVTITASESKNKTLVKQKARETKKEMQKEINKMINQSKKTCKNKKSKKDLSYLIKNLTKPLSIVPKKREKKRKSLKIEKFEPKPYNNKGNKKVHPEKINTKILENILKPPIKKKTAPKDNNTMLNNLPKPKKGKKTYEKNIKPKLFIPDYKPKSKQVKAKLNKTIIPPYKPKPKIPKSKTNTTILSNLPKPVKKRPKIIKIYPLITAFRPIKRVKKPISTKQLDKLVKSYKAKKKKENKPVNLDKILNIYNLTDNWEKKLKNDLNKQVNETCKDNFKSEKEKRIINRPKKRNFTLKLKPKCPKRKNQIGILKTKNKNKTITIKPKCKSKKGIKCITNLTFDLYPDIQTSCNDGIKSLIFKKIMNLSEGEITWVKPESSQDECKEEILTNKTEIFRKQNDVKKMKTDTVDEPCKEIIVKKPEEIKANLSQFKKLQTPDQQCSDSVYVLNKRDSILKEISENGDIKMFSLNKNLAISCSDEYKEYQKVVKFLNKTITKNNLPPEDLNVIKPDSILSKFVDEYYIYNKQELINLSELDILPKEVISKCKDIINKIKSTIEKRFRVVAKDLVNEEKINFLPTKPCSDKGCPDEIGSFQIIQVYNRKKNKIEQVKIQSIVKQNNNTIKIFSPVKNKTITIKTKNIVIDKKCEEDLFNMRPEKADTKCKDFILNINLTEGSFNNSINYKCLDQYYNFYQVNQTVKKNFTTKTGIQVVKKSAEEFLVASKPILVGDSCREYLQIEKRKDKFYMILQMNMKRLKRNNYNCNDELQIKISNFTDAKLMKTKDEVPIQSSMNDICIDTLKAFEEKKLLEEIAIIQTRPENVGIDCKDEYIQPVQNFKTKIKRIKTEYCDFINLNIKQNFLKSFCFDNVLKDNSSLNKTHEILNKTISVQDTCTDILKQYAKMKMNKLKKLLKVRSEICIFQNFTTKINGPEYDCSDEFVNQIKIKFADKVKGIVNQENCENILDKYKNPVQAPKCSDEMNKILIKHVKEQKKIKNIKKQIIFKAMRNNCLNNTILQKSKFCQKIFLSFQPISGPKENIDDIVDNTKEEFKKQFHKTTQDISIILKTNESKRKLKIEELKQKLGDKIDENSQDHFYSSEELILKPKPCDSKPNCTEENMTTIPAIISGPSEKEKEILLFETGKEKQTLLGKKQNKIEYNSKDYIIVLPTNTSKVNKMIPEFTHIKNNLFSNLPKLIKGIPFNTSEITVNGPEIKEKDIILNGNNLPLLKMSQKKFIKRANNIKEKGKYKFNNLTQAYVESVPDDTSKDIVNGESNETMTENDEEVVTELINGPKERDNDLVFNRTLPRIIIEVNNLKKAININSIDQLTPIPENNPAPINKVKSNQKLPELQLIQKRKNCTILKAQLIVNGPNSLDRDKVDKIKMNSRLLTKNVPIESNDSFNTTSPNKTLLNQEDLDPFIINGPEFSTEDLVKGSKNLQEKKEIRKKFKKEFPRNPIFDPKQNQDIYFFNKTLKKKNIINAKILKNFTNPVAQGCLDSSKTLLTKKVSFENYINKAINLKCLDEINSFSKIEIIKDILIKTEGINEDCLENFLKKNRVLINKNINTNCSVMFDLVRELNKTKINCSQGIGVIVNGPENSEKDVLSTSKSIKTTELDKLRNKLQIKENCEEKLTNLTKKLKNQNIAERNYTNGLSEKDIEIIKYANKTPNQKKKIKDNVLVLKTKKDCDNKTSDDINCEENIVMDPINKLKKNLLIERKDLANTEPINGANYKNSDIVIKGKLKIPIKDNTLMLKSKSCDKEKENNDMDEDCEDKKIKSPLNGKILKKEIKMMKANNKANSKLRPGIHLTTSDIVNSKNREEDDLYDEIDLRIDSKTHATTIKGEFFNENDVINRSFNNENDYKDRVANGPSELEKENSPKARKLILKNISEETKNDDNIGTDSTDYTAEMVRKRNEVIKRRKEAFIKGMKKLNNIYIQKRIKINN